MSITKEELNEKIDALMIEAADSKLQFIDIIACLEASKLTLYVQMSHSVEKTGLLK